MKISIGKDSIWVNYHHLACFYQVARGGSLRVAAKAMGIGVSALSIQIRKLEESLSSQLFLREGKQLILTETGKIVLSYCEEIFRLGTEMVESIQDRPAPGRFHLRIAALDSIPKHLVSVFSQAALRTGKCTLSLVEGKTSALLEELLQYRVDVVISNSVPPVTSERKIHTRRVARLPLWVVGAPAFSYLRKGYPRSLEGVPFILPTGDSHVRHEVESFANHMELSWDVVAETQDIMLQKLLAIDGMGVTVAPEFAVREYLKSGQLTQVGVLPEVFEEYFLITSPRRVSNPALAQLVREFAIP